MEGSDLYERIYAIVQRIPEGKVTTYGRIAEIAGCGARQVGYAMSAMPLHAPVPWHRVINALGKISMRSRGDGASTQRDLLEAEGIHFSPTGAVDLDVYGWEEEG